MIAMGRPEPCVAKFDARIGQRHLLGRRQQRIAGDGLRRIGDDLCQQQFELIEHGHDPRLGEKIAVIDKTQLDAAVDLRSLNDEIEFRSGHGRIELHRLTTLELELALAALRQVEQYLKDRVSPGISRRVERFDDALEGQILMGVGAQAHFADTTEQFIKGGSAGEITAQRQRIDEKSDDSIPFRPRPACDSRADDDVLLSAPARQQNVQRREQHHE